MTSTPRVVAVRPFWPGYARIWRWHFYAGLFCIPFILWLAITGAIYLFKPQIDALLDRAYDHIPAGAHASVADQVRAAIAAVPGAHLAAYELPQTEHSAARVIVGKGFEKLLVYVDPQSLAVLGQVDEASRPMNLVLRLHGQLLMGNTGSMIVELAASWAIVMILTGLYLWWPRNIRGLGGVLYPRLGQRGRLFWRDLHGVIGLWVSAFALFLLISGLPWTAFWGGNLQALRKLGSTEAIKQDWAVGSGGHAGHAHDRDPAGVVAYDLSGLDRMVATVAPLALPPPVLIAPPGKDGADFTGIGKTSWTARSETQNRPQRVTLTLDSETGAVLKRESFADGTLLDRIVGTGIAAHEGQLFGWPNQLLGLFTAIALTTLSLSALVMWLRRRPMGKLGAPAPAARQHLSILLAAAIAAIAVLLPLFGLSLLLVLALERALLRRLTAARHWLGLSSSG